MAIDPIVGAKVAGDIGNIVSDGIKELGKTKREDTEQKERTKRESNNARQKETKAREMRKEEVAKGSEATKQKETEEKNSTARHSRDAEKETKIAEISATQDTNKNIMDKTANLIEKSLGVAEKVKDGADKQMQSANEQLNQKDQAIGKYQTILQRVYKEITELRIKEEIRGEVSDKVKNFAELVTEHNEKITNIESDIKRLEKKLQPKKDELIKIDREYAILDSHYDKYNIDFDKEINAIKDLEEYKSSMNKKEYTEAYQRRERKLLDVQDEIEHIELKMLSRERDRLAKDKEMDEDVIRLEELEIKSEYLKTKKTKEWVMGLIEMNSYSTKKITISESERNNFIDAEVSETNKLLTE